MDARKSEIVAACERHGANLVAEAAIRRMNGDRTALPKIGLPDAICLCEAYRITEVAYEWTMPRDRVCASGWQPMGATDPCPLGEPCPDRE